MNRRFLVVSLPVLLGVVASGFLCYVLVRHKDTSEMAQNPATVSVLIAVIVLFVLVSFLCSLSAHQLLGTLGRENLSMRRRLETLERRLGMDEVQAKVMNRINDLHETFFVSRDLNVVLNQAVAALKGVLRVKTLVLQLYSDEQSRFFMRIEEGGQDIDLGEELVSEVIYEGKSRLLNNLPQFPKFDQLTARGYTSLIVAPLNRIELGGQRKSIGFIAALTKERRDFTSYEVDLLTTFASQAALLIENARLYKRVESQAIHDGLTNLFNYRHFREVLAREIQKSEKSGHPLSLIVLDIDDFKKYNDTFGHPEGNEVLRNIAEILLDNTRGKDFVARYGGEEFVVILPETSRQGAMTVAQTIRQQVEAFPFGGRASSHPPVRLSITAGLAVFPDDARSADELIHAADTALYQGKRNGKNQVVSAA
jgi:diguanylate cyclase (GGDEF)-like protein